MNTDSRPLAGNGPVHRDPFWCSGVLATILCVTGALGALVGCSGAATSSTGNGTGGTKGTGGSSSGSTGGAGAGTGARRLSPARAEPTLVGPGARWAVLGGRRAPAEYRAPVEHRAPADNPVRAERREPGERRLSSTSSGLAPRGATPIRVRRPRLLPPSFTRMRFRGPASPSGCCPATTVSSLPCLSPSTGPW